MITYHYFKFLNLQYWYCVVYSLFGGKCTAVDEGTINVATTTISTPAPAPHVGFWDWLFGGGHGVYDGPFAFLVNIFAPLIGFLATALGILWAIYSVLAYTLSGLLILIITGTLLGLLWIRYQELSKYSTLSPTKKLTKDRSRWQELLSGATSTDPKLWRESILAADTMLGELLLKLGYQGSATHERLRAVPEGAFVTLPNAWEAHRIRNFVSARSSDFILTQREAFRVMKLYEEVFEEFDFI
jgi:hypothetical protein